MWGNGCSHGLQPTRLLRPWIFQARVLEWGAIAFSENKNYYSIKKNLKTTKQIVLRQNIMKEHIWLLKRELDKFTIKDFNTPISNRTSRQKINKDIRRARQHH